MKSIIAIFSILFAINVFAQSKPVTYNPATGKIKSPSNFAEQNHLVTNEIICVRVDMFRGGDDDVMQRRAYYWSDAELKVLDKNGNLLYFATTSYNDVKNYHSDDKTWDSDCKIYYYIAGTKYAQAGQCSNPKQLRSVSASQTKSIGAKENVGASSSLSSGQNHPITAIEFFPNLSGKINGTSIREIFLNPENTVIISRKNQNELERTGNGARVWRPTIPQYYRK